MSVFKLLPQSESSFRRKLASAKPGPESSTFKTSWMPDQVRHDGIMAFMDRHHLGHYHFGITLLKYFVDKGLNLY